MKPKPLFNRMSNHRDYNTSLILQGKINKANVSQPNPSANPATI